MLSTIACAAPGQPMSVPVFGTKRYHRSPAGPGSESGVASAALVVPQRNPHLLTPYYNQMSSFYDNQPISSALSSYGSAPIATMNAAQNYQNGYLTENGYYYYPRHEYHSYGMPTYHGDYKPTPFYYAPAPRYSYYDDRDIASNPMDDLHEEILHEDERDRQRELIPYGQESWYQTTNTGHGGARQQDELTNNFLKNLIEYNRQIDAQQRLQQQQQNELLQRDQEHKLQLQLQQQQLRQQQQQFNQQQPFGDEYDEYVELGDYEYEPQATENIYDMKKYEKQDNLPYKQYHQPQPLPGNFNDFEDEDVRQLKSLATHAKAQNLKSASATRNSMSHVNNIKYSSDENREDDENSNDKLAVNNWKQAQIQPESPAVAKSFAQYDNEPEEYDDDTWISWDRKRSSGATTLNNIEKWKNSLKKIEAIKAFDNRKPFSVKTFDETNARIHSTDNSATPSTLSTATQVTASILSHPATTAMPQSRIFGQKEVVLPRPASASQPQMFPHAPQNGAVQDANGNDDTDDDDSVYDNTDSAELNKRSSKDSPQSGNVYETIKQLIEMEHQLEKVIF